MTEILLRLGKNISSNVPDFTVASCRSKIYIHYKYNTERVFLVFIEDIICEYEYEIVVTEKLMVCFSVYLNR